MGRRRLTRRFWRGRGRVGSRAGPVEPFRVGWVAALHSNLVMHQCAQSSGRILGNLDSIAAAT